MWRKISWLGQSKVVLFQIPLLGPLTLHLNISTLFPVSQGMRLLNVYFFFNAFWFSSFFWFGFLDKQPHYKTISLQLHPVLHPITLCYIRPAVVLLGLPAYSFSLFTILGLSAIAIPGSSLAIDVALDRSKVYICFVYWSWHIYFTSWLDNIDEFRWSTAEIGSITTMFILCQV